MKYLCHYEVVVGGLFTDTKIDRTEIIEADSLTEAYENRIAEANRLTRQGLVFSVTKVEPLS